MVDGKQVHKVKNSDRTTFRDVKVYAGDRFHTAADAQYMNLAYENLPEGIWTRSTCTWWLTWSLTQSQPLF